MYMYIKGKGIFYGYPNFLHSKKSKSTGIVWNLTSWRQEAWIPQCKRSSNVYTRQCGFKPGAGQGCEGGVLEVCAPSDLQYEYLSNDTEMHISEASRMEKRGKWDMLPSLKSWKQCEFRVVGKLGLHVQSRVDQLLVQCNGYYVAMFHFSQKVTGYGPISIHVHSKLMSTNSRQ